MFYVRESLVHRVKSPWQAEKYLMTFAVSASNHDTAFLIQICFLSNNCEIHFYGLFFHVRSKSSDNVPKTAPKERPKLQKLTAQPKAGSGLNAVFQLKMKNAEVHNKQLKVIEVAPSLA